MRRPHLAIALLLAFAGSATADTLAPLGKGWSRYANARFGTSLEVPTGLFEADPPPENGDGQSFRAADGARLQVYGTYGLSAIMQPFQAYKEDLLKHAEAEGLAVTYRRGGDTWFVYSGLKGDDIVYAKAIEGCEAVHEFRIVYPSERKRFYDPIVTRLSRTLRCRASR